ncbi:MAG TPA: tetratricopeptide repeat protein [Candidatus Latescibacteria bacterium]|nr:tetratricopeptide repeat protein [Candidatus Latescibacterota bacterium]
MKRTVASVFLLVLILAVARSSGASNPGPARLFNEGNAAYRQGRYEDAIAAYNKVLAGGVRSGAVYYNLGNSYYRTGKLGFAILNYERSLRLDPANDDTGHNLRFVSSLVQDRVLVSSFELKFQEKLSQFLGYTNPNFVAVIVLLAVFVSGGIGGLWLLGRFRTRIAMVIFVGCCVFAALGASVMAGQKWAADEGRTGIVLADQTNARFEPSETSRVVFVVHEGTKVWLIRRDGGWAFVRLANGLRGWVQQGAFEMI